MVSKLVGVVVVVVVRRRKGKPVEEALIAKFSALKTGATTVAIAYVMS